MKRARVRTLRARLAAVQNAPFLSICRLRQRRCLGDSALLLRVDERTLSRLLASEARLDAARVANRRKPRPQAVAQVAPTAHEVELGRAKKVASVMHVPPPPCVERT